MSSIKVFPCTVDYPSTYSEENYLEQVQVLVSFLNQKRLKFRFKVPTTIKNLVSLLDRNKPADVVLLQTLLSRSGLHALATDSGVSRLFDEFS